MTVSGFRFERTKKLYQVNLLTSVKYLTNSCMTVASQSDSVKD